MGRACAPLKECRFRTGVVRFSGEVTPCPSQPIPLPYSKCEVQLEGEGPWQLTASGSVQAASPSSSSGSRGNGAADGSTDDDVLLVSTPGHTAGCLSLLYRPDAALFTGDHLAWSHRLQRLTIFRGYNWHSVEQQLDSVAKLRDLDFLHILPGHGRRWQAADAADRQRHIDELLAAEGWRGGA